MKRHRVKRAWSTRLRNRETLRRKRRIGYCIYRARAPVIARVTWLLYKLELFLRKRAHRDPTLSRCFERVFKRRWLPPSCFFHASDYIKLLISSRENAYRIFIYISKDFPISFLLVAISKYSPRTPIQSVRFFLFRYIFLRQRYRIIISYSSSIQLDNSRDNSISHVRLSAREKGGWNFFPLGKFPTR